MSEHDGASEAERELLDVERAFCRAHVEEDRETMARVLAEEFVGIGHVGNQVDRAEYLDIHLSPDRNFQTFETAAIDIRRYAETALLTGRQTIARVDNEPEESRCTAIYVERDGDWRLVARQDTPLRDDWILQEDTTR